MEDQMASKKSNGKCGCATPNRKPKTRPVKGYKRGTPRKCK